MDITLEQHGAVALLRWNDGENRINLDSLGRLLRHLRELKANEGPLALVLTGTGKFFSNGLDLPRFASNADEFAATVVELDHLFGELLDFPAYTVAAINGHAFAGGAMISSTFDYRIMREDRGYWCMNEAELSLPLAPTMLRTLLARLPQPAVLEAVNTARRYSASEAIAADLVHEAQPEAQVVARALAKAAEVATKDRRVIATHKRLAFGEFADLLRQK